MFRYLITFYPESSEMTKATGGKVGVQSWIPVIQSNRAFRGLFPNLLDVPCYNDDVRLSVCIVNWNTRDDLRECLRALAACPFTGGGQEVIVVDNASADGSAGMVSAEFPDIKLIANGANENFAGGTNQALAAATGDLLLLLNPDAVVRAGTLDVLAAYLKEHPKAGAVAAKLVSEDGGVQRSVRGFPSPGALGWDIVGAARLFPGNRTFGAYRQTFFDYEVETEDASQPMASCFLITREAYEKVGGMDGERFPLFFNDADWCLRAWQAGFTIGYTPKAVVVHGGGGTTKRVRKAAVWESHRALLRFYAKHYRATVPGLVYGMIVAAVTLLAWVRTGYWGKSLGKDGGTITPADLHRELERAR